MSIIFTILLVASLTATIISYVRDDFLQDTLAVISAAVAAVVLLPWIMAIIAYLIS